MSRLFSGPETIKEVTTLCSSLSTKKFAIENLGCSKNQVDAEIMATALIRRGWIFCKENPQEADLVIVNTCGFIESAKKEAVDVILDIKQRFPNTQIIAAGCMAQRYGEKLKNSMPELDAVFGNSAPELITDLIENPLDGQVYIPKSPSAYPARDYLLSFKGSAYVKIAEGCNNRCRYCAIPLIRGSVKSRPQSDIVNEIQLLLSQGIFEINLVAQDLANFGIDRDRETFIGLLKAISQLKGDFWLRLLYIHPDHFPLEILDLMDQDSRILPYFDIPFQHAHIPVLRAMGRRGDADSYLKLITEIKKRRPDAVFRSTFLTGFTGENSRSAKELLDFQQRANLNWLGVFTYSPEEDTPAYKESKGLRSYFERRRGRALKKQIEAAQQKIMENNLKQYLGQEGIYLIEEEIPQEDLYLARGFMQAPEVDGLTVIHGDDLKSGDVV
ncbi:MAG: 30S ribosomal protein S12 methylthiotransferase RimO, partial [Spirochaetaceae bacterium]|nr:30S ribosomal protein S12 methylthiotransferase RimO [Spirochaetaceae bacterium]